MDETRELWNKAAAFHGHVCGGLTIGYKAALYAIELLGLTFSPDEELVCIAETEDFPTEFSGLFSRLYALCRAYSLDIRPVDHVRRHVRRVLAGEAVGCEEDYRQDWAVLCHWVADLYDESLPADLDVRIATKRLLRNESVPIESEETTSGYIK